MFLGALVALAVTLPVASHAKGKPLSVYTITYDPGGRIDEQIAKWKRVNRTHDLIRVDGRCISACTFITGLVPRNKICVTDRAVLEFHSSWYKDEYGRSHLSPSGNETQMSVFPRWVRDWVTARGSLKTTSLDPMRLETLLEVYRHC
jgi:hypothetical protein